MRSQVKAPSAGSNAIAGGRRRSFVAILALLLLAPAALAAAPAVAAPPTVTMGAISAASYASAHVEGVLNTNGSGFAQYSFEYSTDEVSWGQAGSSFSFGSGDETVSADLTNLKGGTKYFVRLFATNFSEDATSAAPNPSFVTLPVDPPTVLKANDATEVLYTTADVSGEIERPANPEPGLRR